MRRASSAPPPFTPPPCVQRLDRVDALRGLAMLWMAAFHFSFDLNQAQLIPRQNFYLDPLWTWQRVVIVTLFVGLAGVGQGLAGAMAGSDGAMPRSARAFWRRWAQIAGCALLVSVGSWWMFPRSFIFFGVLHGMAVTLLLARGGAALMGRAGLAGATQSALWLGVGVLCLVLPQLWQHAFFDSRWTTWVGLGTRKPITEDFAPVMPWFGVFVLGMLGGDRLRRALAAATPTTWAKPLAGALPAGMSGLAHLGRWPLSFYMLHQPVLLAGIALWLWLRR